MQFGNAWILWLGCVVKTIVHALQEQRSSIQGLAQVAEILTLMITCMLEKTFDILDVTSHEWPVGPSVLS